MSDKTLVLIIILVFILILKQNIDCVFVSVGDYPDYRKYGINLPECGLRYGIEIYNISFSANCFAKSLNNITTYIDYSPQNDQGTVSTRIYNGSDARAGESPWTVRLLVFYEVRIRGTGGVERVVERGSRTCTGALVTFQWVITAAHCFLFQDPRKLVEIQVWAGYRDITNTGNVRKLHRHNQFDNNSFEYRINRDIALFQLDKKYDSEGMNEKFSKPNTICLPDNSPPNTNVEDAMSTGWGVINRNLNTPRKLQIAKIRVEASRNCARNLTVCAKPTRRQPKPCTADSGGLLIQYLKDGRAVLIGVLSVVTGAHCMPTRGTDLIEWVSPMAHIQWILETIRNYN